MSTARASDLHVNTVTAAVVTTRSSEWGGRTYAAPVTVRCLIEEQTRVVRAPDGSEVVSSTQIHAAPEYAAALQIDAQIVLPPAPHRPGGRITSVIGVDAVITGDPATDGVVAMCE